MQVYVVLNHQIICTRNGNYSYKTLPICSASIALNIRSEAPAKSVLFFLGLLNCAKAFGHDVWAPGSLRSELALRRLSFVST